MKKAKMGRKPKQENEKMVNAYRLAFNDEDNAKLEQKSQQMLGHVNVGMYIRALVLREINNERQKEEERLKKEIAELKELLTTKN
jgi:hypothetical protein